MTDGIIQTKSGIAFDLLDPTPDMISLDDIAWSLAHICRYNGHCSRFYSVAEHSAIGAATVAAGYGRATQRAFLLHDAAEAYIGDICRPLKKLLGPAISAIEVAIQNVVHLRFGITDIRSGHIKNVDDLMLAIEVSQIVPAPLVGSWPDMTDAPWTPETLGRRPEDAYQLFLAVADGLGIPR